jgi:hypothetical protein
MPWHHLASRTSICRPLQGLARDPQRTRLIKVVNPNGCAWAGVPSQRHCGRHTRVNSADHDPAPAERLGRQRGLQAGAPGRRDASTRRAVPRGRAGPSQPPFSAPGSSGRRPRSALERDADPCRRARWKTAPGRQTGKSSARSNGLTTKLDSSSATPRALRCTNCLRKSDSSLHAMAAAAFLDGSTVKFRRRSGTSAVDEPHPQTV